MASVCPMNSPPSALMAPSEPSGSGAYAQNRAGNRDSSQRSTGCCLGRPRLSWGKSRMRMHDSGVRAHLRGKGCAGVPFALTSWVFVTSARAIPATTAISRIMSA